MDQGTEEIGTSAGLMGMTNHCSAVAQAYGVYRQAYFSGTPPCRGQLRLSSRLGKVGSPKLTGPNRQHRGKSVVSSTSWQAYTHSWQPEIEGRPEPSKLLLLAGHWSMFSSKAYGNIFSSHISALNREKLKSPIFHYKLSMNILYIPQAEITNLCYVRATFKYFTKM